MSLSFYESVKAVLDKAKQDVYRAINFSMVDAYWHIGCIIVEEEQQGNNRADYGIGLLKDLSRRLTNDFGKGLDERELRRIRQFYLAFPIRDALRPELSWTHYRLLLRLPTPEARQWYGHEAIQQNWNSRVLDRQISTQYYERTLSTQNPSLSDSDPSSSLRVQPKHILKDPYILDFLNIDTANRFQEKDIEQALLENLQTFMLELGKGFAFVARQQRIDTETSHFYIDLVFYNYILKCFVLIDLKVGKLTHQDIGQMDMYVRLYEDLRKLPGDNPTIGLILCSQKDETVVKYSVLNGSEHLFASRYRFVLPTEAELKAELERENFLLDLARSKD